MLLILGRRQAGAQSLCWVCFPSPRSALESLPDPTALSEKEGRLLLAALVKAYVQRKANELEQEQEQEEMEGSR